MGVVHPCMWSSFDKINSPGLFKEDLSAEFFTQTLTFIYNCRANVDEWRSNSVSNPELCHKMLTWCNGTIMFMLAVVMSTDNSHDLCYFGPGA